MDILGFFQHVSLDARTKDVLSNLSDWVWEEQGVEMAGYYRITQAWAPGQPQTGAIEEQKHAGPQLVVCLTVTQLFAQGPLFSCICWIPTI